MIHWRRYIAGWDVEEVVGMTTADEARPPSVEAPTASPARREGLWYAGVSVATAAAIFYALVSWIPWALVTGEVSILDQRGKPQFTTYSLRLTPGDTEGAFGSLVIGAIAVLGLLIVPSLWLTRGRWSRVLAAGVLCGWVVALVDTVPITYPLHTGGIELTDNLKPHALNVVSSQNLGGFGLAVASAIVLNVSGVFLLLVGIVTARRGGHVQQIEQRRQRGVPLPRAGAGAFVLAVVMLLASVFAVGWAADDCTASPLLVGSCTGLTFNGVEYYGIQSHTDLFDPIASLHAIPLFILLGASLILLALWARRRITPGLCLWITLWLAAATFFVIVAVAGVGDVTEHAADLGLQAGMWKGQTGAYLAGTSLVIGWLALVSLWYTALRPGRAESRPAN